MRKLHLFKKRILALVLSASMVFAPMDTYMALAAAPENSEAVGENTAQTDETETAPADSAIDPDTAGEAGSSDDSDAGGEAGSPDGSDAGEEAGSPDGSDAGEEAGSPDGSDAGGEAGSPDGSDAGGEAGPSGGSEEAGETDSSKDSDAAEDSDAAADENETGESLDEAEPAENETEEGDGDEVSVDAGGIRLLATEDILGSGQINDITWFVDGTGLLIAEGTGDWDTEDAPWWEVSSRIKSAKIKIEGITSVRNMFSRCVSLESVDLSGLDTSNVTSMGSMFYLCRTLDSIDLSGLDTSNVTDMADMFSECRGLKSVDLSGLDTSNVTNMRNMFNNCSSLESVDLSGLDMGNVTNMGSMFGNCSSLESVDLSGLDMGNVTNMGSVFGNCSSLESVDLSGSDISSVGSLGGMFNQCRSLKSVNLSGLKADSVTRMNSMFSDCTKLESVDLSGLKAGSVTTMESMFYGCTSLKSVDLSDIGANGVTNIDGIFYNCSSLESIDLSGLNVAGMSDAGAIFSGCTSLSYICTPINWKPLFNFGWTLPVNAGEVWHRGDTGEECKNLPADLPFSVELFRGSLPNGNGRTKYVAHISGITIKDKVYDGTPAIYEGIPVVKDAAGNIMDITPTVSYTGTLINGTLYRSVQPPTQAGKYTLYLDIPSDNMYYRGEQKYIFRIKQKELTITAPSFSVKIDGDLPELSGAYCTVEGLIGDEELKTEPKLRYSAEDISTDVRGSYEIIPYGADAGNDYKITYKNGTLTISASVVDVTSVSLNKKSLNMQLNQTEKLTATVKPDNAGNKIVTWTSSKPLVATVGADGTVTAANAGTTTITAATHNGKTASCTVNVYEYTLNETEWTFDLSSKPDETLLLTASDGIEADINSTVTWSSNDESVAKVSKGIVTPTGVGTAKILAAIKNGPTLTCEVTVTRDTLESISLGDSECTLNVGDTKQMKVYLTPSDTEGIDITWKSDNSQIAAVTADSDNPAKATVKAVAPGSATITVTVTSKSGQTEAFCKVTVRRVITEEELLKDNKIPSGLTALTNEQSTLGDVLLPEGWAWLDPNIPLKQFAGMQSKSFAAQYTTGEKGVEPYDTSLPVALSTVTAISIGIDSSSVHTDETRQLSINWNMNGWQLDNTYMSKYAEKITWSIDKPNVAELSPDNGLTTTLTAKSAGSATIKVQAAFEDKIYKAQYKVTVIDSGVQIADIRIASIEDFTPDAAADTVTASTYSYTGESLPGSGMILVTMTNATKLTVKSNNTKVVSVGKVTKVTTTETTTEDNYTIPLTVSAAGTAQITLTADDAAKTQKEIWLSVTSAKPNISEDTITVNLQQTTGTTFFLYPNAGYEVEGASLAGDKADKFTLDQPTETGNDSYVIKAKEGTAKGTYILSLNAKVKRLQGGTQDNVPDQEVVFTVKVVDQAPKYKIKQSTKVNLFYKDPAGLLEITSDETLEKVELAGDCDFKVELKDGSYYIIPKSNDLETNCNKKGTLTLHFQGYKDVTANYTVGVEKKAPKVALVSTSVTLYPSAGLNRTIVKAKGSLDEGTTVTLDDTGRNAGFSITGGNGQWFLTGAGLTKKATVKAKLIFRNVDLWGEEEVEVSYTINVNMGIPAAKLQKSSLQLNMNPDYMAYDAASTEVMWKTGALFEPLDVTVSAADVKAQDIINKGVVFRFDKSENHVIARLNNDNSNVAKGSYKFKVNVRVTETLTVSTPLTIKIVDIAKEKAVKLSSKGSIDVLNRQGSFVTVTPALQSLNGTITGVKLSGMAAHLFDAACEENKIIIHAKEGVALITKYNYKVKLDLTIRNAEGDEIQYTTSDVNLKLKQGAPKVTIVPKQTVFFSGTYNSMTQNISAALKGAENPVITNVELMNNQDAFELKYSDDTGVITLDNTRNAVKGKTYSLQLKVTFEGQADNEKVTTVKYSVKVK